MVVPALGAEVSGHCQEQRKPVRRLCIENALVFVVTNIGGKPIGPHLTTPALNIPNVTKMTIGQVITLRRRRRLEVKHHLSAD